MSNMHEFDAVLEEAVATITSQAECKNTHAEYVRAAHKIEGICACILLVRAKTGDVCKQQTTRVLNLGEAINRMYELAECARVNA